MGDKFMQNKIKCCMDFSNDEILKHLITPLKSYPQLKIRFMCEFGFDITDDSTDLIGHVYFYERNDNLHLFLGDVITSIFITDEEDEIGNAKSHENCRFYEQIMFIDDTRREIHHSINDTYGNIVYEGNLCNKTKAEMLTLFREMIIVLAGTEKMTFESSPMASNLSPDKKNYIVKIENPSSPKKVVDFEIFGLLSMVMHSTNILTKRNIFPAGAVFLPQSCVGCS